MIRSVPHAMMQEMSEGNFLRWPKRGLDDCKCILGVLRQQPPDGDCEVCVGVLR